MKNFQILTLMMMFVMVIAAPQHKDPSLEKTKKQLLADIHECASTLKQLAEELKNGTKLPKVKTISDSSTCVEGFFCLAEKVLKHANLSANLKPAANNLTRVLNVYNKKTGNNNCTLHTNNTKSFISFLEDIKNCT
ncbi:uncharacterized protein LOC144524988 isoform X2 [Sander vitreus]